MRKLCFDDREAGVVIGVGLVVGSVIGNPLNDLFGVVSPSERTFCVSPIGFGLASMTGRHDTDTSLRIAEVAGGFRSILLNSKILQVINVIRLVEHANDEVLLVLSVAEAGQTKEARDVRSRWIAAILRSQRT